MVRIGEMMGLVISLSYLTEFKNISSSCCLSSIYLVVILSINVYLDTQCSVSGSGFIFLFYVLIFVPFMSTLPLRLISAASPIWSTALSLFLFALGLKSSLSQETVKSHLLVIVASLILCPVSTQTNIIFTIPFLYLLF